MFDMDVPIIETESERAISSGKNCYLNCFKNKVYQLISTINWLVVWDMFFPRYFGIITPTGFHSFQSVG